MMDEATIRSRHRKAGANVDLHEQWRSAVTGDQLSQVAALAESHAAGVCNGGRLAAGSEQLTQRLFDELHEQRAWWSRRT